MPALSARIDTDRGSRYLTQFCKHAAAMGAGGHGPRMHLSAILERRQVQVSAEWTDTSGTVTFTPWGRCTLSAGESALDIRIDAADEQGLAQIRDVITRDLERFSRREPLTVAWTEPDEADDGPFRPAAAMRPPRRARRPGVQAILLILAVAVVIAVHVGLAGTIASRSPWTGLATTVILLLVAVKLAVLVLARMGWRRRKTRAGNGGGSR